MKNSFISCTLALLLLAVAPFAAHADPNYDGLAELLIGLALVFLVFFLISLIASIVYFRKGGNASFYTALITAFILYVVCGAITPVAYAASFNLLSAIPLVPLGILCCRSIKFKSTAILPYAGMTLITMSVAGLLVNMLPFVVRSFRQLPVFSLIFSIGSISLFTWLLVKALMKADNSNPREYVFKKANLMALLTIGISLGTGLLQVLFIYRYRGLMVSSLFSFSYILEWLLPLLLASNLTTLLALRYLRSRCDDDFAGPPL